ncbi:MAG: translocation/assembly module TamB domain-containing protein, partial [Pseudomonadota bacterium]
RRVLPICAALQADATFSDGGRIRVQGPVGLTGQYPADLSVTLSELRLFDPALYEALLRGRLSLTGPLAGGARIGGGITVERAELRIADTGLSFGSAVPDITHLGIGPGAQATRQRAGLLSQASGSATAGSSASFPLDLVVRAPGQIFVRGRGLDAELGGELRISGNSSAPIPSGGFELLRGRIDLLGKRIVLDEGRVTLAGSFLPFVRLVARAISGDVTSIITVEGPVDDPEISFSSEPELPEDEVLSQLFFGRSIASISPFQAAQLASAVGTLTGRGQGGFVEQIRSGIGLDDLDVGTTEDGTTQVRAGRYISENIYTDVTTGSDGNTEINLKIDLTDNVTIQGSTDNSGNSGIGIFFERDY